MAAPQDYWERYAATLQRIRAEKPDTFAALKGILDSFDPELSCGFSGDAFFPNAADDVLSDALIDAGWVIRFEESEGDYLWSARHPVTSARIRFVEGDVYDDTTK